MNATMDKTRLLDLIKADWDFLQRTLALVSDEQMVSARVEGDWTIKDLLAHISRWERWAIERFAEARAGQKPTFLGSDEAVNRFNHEGYLATKDRPLAQVRDDFEATHAALLTLVAELSAADLFGGSDLAGYFWDPPYNVIVFNTYDHYHEHAEAIREWLGIQ